MDLNNNLAVVSESPDLEQQARALARRLSLPFLAVDDAPSQPNLSLGCEKLVLQLPGKKPFYIDFLSGKAQHRRAQGGGLSQDIAKACGFKRDKHPLILDVTAGLGRDAFILACLGARVTMIERSAIMGALLEDGLRRLKLSPSAQNIDLSLNILDARRYLAELEADSCPDVIYFDPMHPERSKSAAVKREMCILRDIVGSDDDKADLFSLACQKARKRVVVKWPAKAKAITDKPCDIQYLGKSTRFDVYLT